MAKKSDAATLQTLSYRDTPVGYINLVVFLESALCAEQLRAEYEKKATKGRHRTPVGIALFQGFWELNAKAKEYAQRLTERGQLLFAFPGTTVLQGGAA